MPKGKKFIVQLWDCPTCGEKEINALLYKMCPKCLQPLSDDFLNDLNYTIDMYLEEGDPIRDLAEGGPDWLCGRCGRRNSAKYTICDECGVSREEGEAGTGAVDHDGITTGGINNWLEDDSQLAKEREEERNKLKGKAERKIENTISSISSIASNVFSSIKRFIIPGAIIAVAIAGVAFLIYLFTTTYPTTVIAHEHKWNRVINTQKYSAIQESEWESHPYNAYNISSKEEIHHYDKVYVKTVTKYRTEYETVQDGYETIEKTKNVITGYETKYRRERQGNGTVEEVTYQEPIYGTEVYTEQVPKYKQIEKQVPYQEDIYEDVPVYKVKYYYTINKWVSSTPIRSFGIGRNPYWPEFKEYTPPPKLGDLKSSGKSETYIIIFLDEKEESFERSYTRDVWFKIEEGQKFPAKKNLMGIIVEIDLSEI